MTHVTCPSCELRFARRAVPSLTSCPFCGGPLTEAAAARLVGYQLADPVVSIDEVRDVLSDMSPAPPTQPPTIS